MNEIELLTKKFIKVRTDDVKISTKEKPIIGTDALATCYGVIIYSEERKLAIVAHISSKEPDTVIDKIFQIILKEKLRNEQLQYKIIPGCYEENKELKNKIEKYFKSFENFKELDIPDYAIRTDELTSSKEFAFDASTKEFVTNKVLFGTDYYIINNELEENNLYSTKHK